MAESHKNPLWQVIAVCLVLAFIMGISVLSFLFSQEKWTVTAELITLISFLVLICLGFFFDTVQIGKISLLKSELREKDSYIRSLQSTIANSQISSNIVSPRFEFSPQVEASSANRVERDRLSEENDAHLDKAEKEQRKKRVAVAKSRYIDKVCEEKQIPRTALEEDVKIRGIEKLDPFSPYCPVFDYYYEFGEFSEFIVFKQVVSNFYLIKFQLYMMLSKLYMYNQHRNARNSLKLVLLQDTAKNDCNYETKLKEDFYPACTSGLLVIEQASI